VKADRTGGAPGPANPGPANPDPADVPAAQRRQRAAAALADRRNHLVTVESQAGWVAGKVTAPVPDETGTIAFGVFLAGPGRIELRDVELVSD